MKQRELVRSLLRKARQDEAVLERLLPDAEFDDETVGFHAQQAVEKLLKAWLAHLGVGYPRMHRLGALARLLSAKGHLLPDEVGNLDDLTPFATIWRYEDLPASASFDRKEALRLVRKIRTYVESQIGEQQPRPGR